MIFNSKQLEELENIHDSTGAFEEEGEDDGNFEEIGEAAMDWRRGLIEEAAENIKRAKTRPVEPHLTYPIGSMLFEREARRFARVQRSVPGYLKIIYLSGGDREFGNLDVTAYLRDFGAEKRLSELSEQLGMSDVDVAIELDRLGITPVEELEAEEVAAAEAAMPPMPPMPPMPGKKAKAAKVEEVEAEEIEDESEEEEEVDEVEAEAEEEIEEEIDEEVEEEVAEPVKGKKTALPAPAKKKATTSLPAPAPKSAKAPAVAKVAKTPKAVDKPKVPVVERKRVLAATAAVATGLPSAPSSINPIDDPNSYIKAHYSEMSNRELARVTGLSEHTIRRKLGEWGLKRKPA